MIRTLAGPLSVSLKSLVQLPFISHFQSLCGLVCADCTAAVRADCTRGLTGSDCKTLVQYVSSVRLTCLLLDSEAAV